MQEQNNLYAAPAARVEQINDNVEKDKASRLVRLGGFLVDVILSMVALAPYYYETFRKTMALASGESPTIDSGMSSLALTGILVAAALGIVNLVLLWKSGQTIGKKVVGTRIVRTDGSRAGFARLFFLRYLVPGIVSAIPLIGFVFWLIDSLWIFGEQRRCVHDLIADTIVVDA